MLELKNLCKKYKKTPILDRFSLSLQRGDIAILLGHSGAGKSTLIRVLNSLETADSGEILLDGASLALSSPKRSDAIGMVFQSYHLFDHLTALDNLTLPLSFKKTKEEARSLGLELLKTYNLSDKANTFPSKLSGGQKQRLAIARALTTQPQILCLDEPTAALDPKHTREVASEIEDLASQGYILLIATHDTALLRTINCQIHLMEKGAIVESAHSSDLFQNTEKYNKLHSYLEGKR